MAGYRAERSGHWPAACEQSAAGVCMAGDAIAGASQVLALGDEGIVGRLRRGAASQKHKCRDGVKRQERMDPHKRSPPQFGSLPQASGIGSVPFGTGDGSTGMGIEASQAATAVTSLSVRLAATSCMQSGSAAVRVP
jgi:hypothetical protein